MTPKLAALSGFGNQARHRPVRYLLSVLALLKTLTRVPTAEKSPKRRLSASPLRPRGVEQRARELSAAATLPAQSREGGAGEGRAAP